MKAAARVAAALGASAGVVALMVAEPAVASAAPGSTNVPCTGQSALVAAINAANSAGGGTIVLARGCDYALTSASSGEDGLPAIVTPVAVKGNGATIDGTDTFRVFEVHGAGGSLSLDHVTVTGGAADLMVLISDPFGGGILNVGGTVTLNDSQVTGNTALDGGGGIATLTVDPTSVARLRLNGSEVNDNSQTSPGAPGGGGILNVLGSVSVNTSQVSDNTAQGFSGGAIASGDYFGFSGTSSLLDVNNSQIDGNVAPNAGGGGIQNLLGSVSINNAEVDGNSALNGGGIASGNGNGGAPPGTSHLSSTTPKWMATPPPLRHSKAACPPPQAASPMAARRSSTTPPSTATRPA
jgi:hypothetical protein